MARALFTPSPVAAQKAGAAAQKAAASKPRFPWSPKAAANAASEASKETLAPRDPRQVAMDLGFDLSQGIFGPTPFAELWTGRLAMAGIATGIAEEIITGAPMLQQLGVATPNDTLFTELVAFWSLATAFGVASTLYRLQKGTMDVAEFWGYSQLFGLNEQEVERIASEKKLKGDFFTTGGEGRAGAAAASVDDADAPDAVNMVAFADLKDVEIINGRAAMVGFLAAIAAEAHTGAGIFGQLVAAGQLTGLLGADSGAFPRFFFEAKDYFQ